MKADYRAWRAAQRTSGFGVPVPAATQSALEVSAEVRTKVYQTGWDQGSLVGILTAYTDMITDKYFRHYERQSRDIPD